MTTDADSPAHRAERLRVALFMFGLVKQPPPEAMEATWPLLTAEDVALFRRTSDDDLALANACLAAEGELRARQWAALEGLLALVPPGEGGLDDRLLALPQRQFAGAAQALIELGWVDR